MGNIPVSYGTTGRKRRANWKAWCNSGNTLTEPDLVECRPAGFGTLRSLILMFSGRAPKSSSYLNASGQKGVSFFTELKLFQVFGANPVPWDVNNKM